MYTPDIGIFPPAIREFLWRYDATTSRLCREEYVSPIKEGEFKEWMTYPGSIPKDSGPFEIVSHKMRIADYERWLIMKNNPRYQAGVDRQTLREIFPSWRVPTTIEEILTHFGSNYAPLGSRGFNTKGDSE